MKEENFGAEEIYLAPPTEVLGEARDIGEKTVKEEKFPFVLQYDENQKDFLLTVLDNAAIVVEREDEETHSLEVSMNMTQLSFIKKLDYVERVKTDEGINTQFASEIEEKKEFEETAADTVGKLKSVQSKTTVVNASETNADNGIAVACVGGETSSCDCPITVDMASAQEIMDERYINNCICCPRAEQWFKFVPQESKEYTIRTTGSMDTVGYLYDCCGCLITSNDDFAGKLNFRIVQTLTAGRTYYIRVCAFGNQTGSYILNVTDRILASSVNINKTQITLEKGVLYELPITPNYTYKGYNGAQRISGLSVSISPSNASQQKVWWWEQNGNVLECLHGWDNNDDRYIHVRALEAGTSKLYAEDWNENGTRDECTVMVETQYEKQLRILGGFSNEEINLILKLYDSVEAAFPSESMIQKAWRSARLLSEFSYGSFSFNDVAGSLTNEETRQTYFTNSLGYTENEYNTLKNALIDNHKGTNVIDFTHFQYSLAARLAYTLDEDGWASNLGSQFKTGNWGIYSDEDISYLGGWLGDATLRNDGGTGVPILKNDDYMADLDAENIYRLILQGNSSVDAINSYYSNMNVSNTRADIFLQHIPYSTVKEKIFYELIDADLYVFMTNASNQGDIYMTRYWLNLINDEQYHFDETKSRYPDTYDFLMSLNDRRLTMAHYE